MNNEHTIKRHKIYKVILISLVCLIITQIIIMSTTVSSLNSKIVALAQTVDTSQATYTSLNEDYNTLQVKHTMLQNNYEELVTKNAELEKELEEATSSELDEEIAKEVARINGESKLTADLGVNYYKGNKETYYNLDMAGVINIAKYKGYVDTYWVREDGVKMYGDYVLAAANYKTHPYGSIVETSLGTAIVLDTGHLAENQFDIAVTW